MNIERNHKGVRVNGMNQMDGAISAKTKGLGGICTFLCHVVRLPVIFSSQQTKGALWYTNTGVQELPREFLYMQ